MGGALAMLTRVWDVTNIYTKGINRRGSGVGAWLDLPFHPDCIYGSAWND